MSKKLICAISGSPSANSRTAKVVDYVLQGLRETLLTRHIQLRDMDPEALILAKAQHVSVARTVTAIEQADGLIIATPIFRHPIRGC
jgi:FMN reductase